ncbi:uncharacterized protein LOC107800552 [Nicotiana tabacum]|uniref:Uncharacterized protein DDB_G0279979-like n=2 Tax=Nicotiana TaxID=4085 RepID=A0A1S4ARB6_TOBAC|nr:PREDICTED: uncharacterized protein DDB_G0279979-like [Nicotiana sylvestris]XP_016479229.1 PREDICTED: uncharacterized protein DDB_G0279979-like [Nicotiana tabacum]
MGACASAPKDLKAEAKAAPLPEQPKEEETTTTTTTAVPEVTVVDKEVNGEDEEKKVEDGDVAKPKEDEKVAGDMNKSNSLGTLLNETEVEKESVKDETTDKKPEEAKVEELAASDANKETDAQQPAAAEEAEKKST